jgi:hypothetical protein
MNADEQRLLRDVVNRRAPHLLWVLDAASLPADTVLEVQSLLASELLEYGLKADDEPNTYGLQIDHLIGSLGMSQMQA